MLAGVLEVSVKCGRLPPDAGDLTGLLYVCMYVCRLCMYVCMYVCIESTMYIQSVYVCM